MGNDKLEIAMVLQLVPMLLGHALKTADSDLMVQLKAAHDKCLPLGSAQEVADAWAKITGTVMVAE